MAYSFNRRHSSLLLGTVAGILILMGGFSFIQREAWDGGFGQAEFRLRFVDEEGAPVPGVQLVVRDKNGARAYCYPVIDYQETMQPMSDDSGLMTFHHINLSPEYGGKCWRLFFVIPMGDCDPPVYTCHFMLAGREIGQRRFHELYAARQDRFDRGKEVEWEWSADDSCLQSLPPHLNPTERSIPRTLSFRVYSSDFPVGLHGNH
jgi:hypothetical protein